MWEVRLKAKCELYEHTVCLVDGIYRTSTILVTSHRFARGLQHSVQNRFGKDCVMVQTRSEFAAPYIPVTHLLYNEFGYICGKIIFCCDDVRDFIVELLPQLVDFVFAASVLAANDAIFISNHLVDIRVISIQRKNRVFLFVGVELLLDTLPRLKSWDSTSTRPLAVPVLRLSVTAWCPTRRSIFTQGSPFELIPCDIY